MRVLKNRLDYLMDKEPMKSDLTKTDATIVDIQEQLKEQMYGRQKTMDGLKKLSMLMSNAQNVLPKGLLSEVQKNTADIQTDDGHQFLFAMKRECTQKFVAHEGVEYSRPQTNSQVV